MAKAIDLQNIVKHIVNGTFGQNLCRICLLPLEDLYEDAFTAVCKENNEYCVADVLEIVCNIQISPRDKYKVCSSCFIAASEVYKFYLMTQRNEEIINFYVDELNNQVNFIYEAGDIAAESLCITLPHLEPTIPEFDLNIENVPLQSLLENKNNSSANSLSKVKSEYDNFDENEENILIILKENGEPTYYKAQLDELLENDENEQKHIPVGRKRKRKRNPMEYRKCSRCPVKYRFIRKLKEHMKADHSVDLFVCKVCQALVENEQEFNNHLQTHTGIHTCAICNMVFKKRESIIAHFEKHEELKNISKMEGAHVCEICGIILKSAEHLEEHNEKKHEKRYTCYYCGKMYKMELNFELHLRKHEINNDIKQNPGKIKKEPPTKQHKYTCSSCGKHFVNERALLWHERLHNNERPYVCDVCGRAFVSLNRRNQHATCAHTAPSRRCPLCPALFHMRSMVNTHIKKVHLKAHKRRKRTTKHQNVFWKTETVPIQELSVSIQNEILELQAAQGDNIQTAQW